MNVLKGLLITALLSLAGGLGLYFFAPGTLMDLAIAAQRQSAGLHSEEVQINGFKVHYLDSQGTGAPLMLVHGFGGNTDNWLAIAPELTAHFRLIIPDLPGFGASDAPTQADYTIQQQAARLAEFLSEIGLQRVHLAGNSMGGAIVAAFAAAHPNRAASLWLVANAGVRNAPLTPVMQRLSQGELEALAPKTPEAYAELLDLVTEKPPPIPAVFKQVYGERAVARQALRQRQLEQLAQEQWAVEDHLQGLPVPTHILWGDKDQILHVGAVDSLMQILPSASKTVLPGIGHVPMLEAPGRTAKDYLAFRDRLQP